MALGPGKYDELATYVREQAEASGVVVIVFDGNKGGGFSTQADWPLTLSLPSILRNIADQMERDTEGSKDD